jgi:hypothetical protein
VLVQLERMKKERVAECEKRLAAAKKSVAERKAARAKALATQKAKYEAAIKKYRAVLESLRDKALKADKARAAALKAEEALAELASEYAHLLAHKFAAQRGQGPKLSKKQEATFAQLEARLAECRQTVEARVSADAEHARTEAVSAAFAAADTAGFDGASGAAAKVALAAVDVDTSMLDNIGATNDEASNKLGWLLLGVYGAAMPRSARVRAGSAARAALCGGRAEVEETTGAVRAAGILELPPGVLVVTDKRVIAMNADVADKEKVAGAPAFTPDSVQLRLMEGDLCNCSCFANCCLHNRIHKYKLTATWGADDTAEFIDMNDVIGPVVRKATTVAQMEAIISSDAPLAAGGENKGTNKGGFPSISCFAALCCLCHKDWSVEMDKSPKMLINRSIAFQVKRLPKCDMVPEEMRGMWAHMRVHFKAAMTVDALNAVMNAFGGVDLPSSAISEGAIPELPSKPLLTPLPELKALEPLLPVSTMRAVMKEAEEKESKKASGSSSKSSDECCGQPINVAIRIGGNDDKQAVTVKSKAKEHSDDLSA